MKRIRHLSHCDYVVYLGQRLNVVTLANQCSVILERTWHALGRNLFEIQGHVKFNADAMNGVQVMARMIRNGVVCSSVVSSIKLYRVNEANWSETLIGTFTPSESPRNIFTTSIPQSTLGANELSGKETYAVEFFASRKRKKYTNKLWFNHLGCFDSILRLKNEISYHHILKLDE